MEVRGRKVVKAIVSKFSEEIGHGLEVMQLNFR